MADDELEMDSATVSENQDAPDAQQHDQVESGSESSDEPEGEKFDLLSVVRGATDAEEDGDSASPAGQEQEATKPEGEDASAQEDGAAPDNEGFSDVPFHTHPRFKELVAQRNQYREGAQKYDQIENFLRTNGVSAEEAASMLTIQAQMKTDPAGAWQKLKPVVQQLLVDAGEILPADLKQRVQRGEMTQQAAVEFNRLRAAQSSGQKAQEHRQQVEAYQREQDRVASIQQSVAQWEQSTRAKDPDFDKKQEALQKEVLWLQKRDGMPQTADDARKMIDTAYTSVTKAMASRQRPQPKSPVTGGRVASGQPSAPPKSMLDVVQRARAQG